MPAGRGAELFVVAVHTGAGDWITSDGEESAVGKAENLAVGLIIGAAVGAAIAYIFGPSRSTTFDASYRSRWERALAEGKKAE